MAKLLEKYEYKNYYGRPNYIEKYNNPDGYKYKCRSCKTKSAHWQLALFDHLHQPQGSLYYCDVCIPPDYSIIVD